MILALPRFYLAVTLLFLVGCSTRPLADPYYKVPVKEDMVSNEEMSWWAYRFRIRWPEEDAAPDFVVDLMLAHEVIKPVLVNKSDKLLWWRFHRRAGREKPGHQFSFLFYSDRNTATEIINEINNNALLGLIKESGLIKKTVSSSTAKVLKPEIEAYSDSSWSPEVQRAWPSYIMGVSSFWLSLIDEIKTEQEKAGKSDLTGDINVDSLLMGYRKVDERITEIWQKEGQHVLFHHSSAVFGYKPMRFRKEVIF
jgi:hypothetical protein